MLQVLAKMYVRTPCFLESWATLTLPLWFISRVFCGSSSPVGSFESEARSSTASIPFRVSGLNHLMSSFIRVILSTMSLIGS